MPSTEDVERPPAVLAVVGRYLRRERPLSALLAVVVVSVFVGTYLVTSLLAAVVVGAMLAVAVRVPLLRPHGTVRLETDADPETVVDSFAAPTPPVLPFQWGVADEVTADGEAVTYHVSYLFGLRSVDMTLRTRTEATAAGARRVELELTADGRPWSTYDATIRRDGDRTVVDVEYAADRRFGPRRLPQRIVADRYRDEALAVQGYSVVERDEGYV
ncbi:hypothetical protein [Natronomonas marina]|jgi:hypothetical protein|uniref:hypothetical protein n=1 Tax=Natronomonas marina TaxID=2961939 RepID=UPI0020CA1391|nr:hypothetical protein [Natronomonas marina]